MAKPKTNALGWTNMGMTRANIIEQAKQKKLHPRERLADDVEAFLKNGGTITKVPSGASGGPYGKP